MNLVKNTIAALAVASTAILPMTTSAQAGERGYNGYNRDGQRIIRCHPDDPRCQPVRHRESGRVISRNDAAGIAVLGIIGGAIIGSAIANQNRNQYDHQPQYVRPRPAPQPRYGHNEFPPAPERGYVAPRVVTYGGSLEPWSRGWYNYCEDRYRSFNPQKGTYRGYDGRDHFCVAK
ncbi:MAG: BA14K family protein [Ahrensia sp.]|nr:BA14K family protein [Ahrensia sp.]